MPEEFRPVVIFSTAPDLETGKRLARQLVSQRLAACVNLSSEMTSIYHWKGALEESTEVLLMLKTDARYLERVRQFLKEEHPYEVPECIMLSIDDGSPEYLDWMKTEIAST